MNKGLVIEQQSFFIQRDARQKEMQKWVNDVNRFHEKSIYNLTWNSFYHELHKLGIKRFLYQYGFSSRKKLQLFIARSVLGQEKVTLYDFEKSTELELIQRLKSHFFNKVKQQPNFNPKRHKLSTIHYYLYFSSLEFTSISLGFSCKQYFLNFFMQTLYISECKGNGAENLRKTISSLVKIDPIALREELDYLYDEPLAQNIHFSRYNYTLTELKLVLEKEDFAMVVASLGGCSAYIVNKKLQSLNINITLQDLKHKSWIELRRNIPILWWNIKLYQLFSGQIPLEQRPFNLNIPRPLRQGISRLYWQFFCIQQRTQIFNEGRHIHTATEGVWGRLYQYLR